VADLVWCRDVLSLVDDLDAAYREFRRVLKPGGRAVVYQMFTTSLLEPTEAAFLLPVLGCSATAMRPENAEAAIVGAGLRIDRCIVLGSEWGEYYHEHVPERSRHLLHAARLQRDPDRYIARFGKQNYDIKLGDCLWHIYRMIGKLSSRVYLLSAPADPAGREREPIGTPVPTEEIVALRTKMPGLELVRPDADRDSPAAVGWLAGDVGRSTLSLMGNTEEHIGPTTLETERARIQGFIDSDEQLTWTLKLDGRPVGVIWVDLLPTDHVLAPAVHIMIGDPSARGHGVGRAALAAVIAHLSESYEYASLHSRHLTANRPVTHLLRSAGFTDLGEPYVDSDGLRWQNVVLDLTAQ
jgi:RimJ/RimL family protein N-acetyltransferase